MILASADSWLAGIGLVGGGSGVVALFRAFTIDPRAARMAERREREELQGKIDDLYREKRQAEEREREARRRIETQDDEIRRLTGRVGVLEDEVQHWMGRALGGRK